MKNFIWEVEEKVCMLNKGIYFWVHSGVFNTRSGARECIKNQKYRNNFRIIKKELFSEEPKKRLLV